MFKSVFEASIDKLGIPENVKKAIKNINNICLEAEGPSADQSVGKVNRGEGMYNQNITPEQAKAMYAAKQSTDANDGAKKPEANVANSATDGNAKPASNKAKPANAETAETPEQAKAKPPVKRYSAEVATVQYFLQSTIPDMKIAVDGIMGPKTINVIQTTEEISPTGKMDKETKEAFGLLLAEAKNKVKAIQGKLGVAQDGLIGKQTLAALNKAKMTVASIFNDKTSKSNAKQPQIKTAQANNSPAQEDITSIRYDAEKAEKALKAKYISQKEFDIWKTYGIAPMFQRRKPQATQAQIAKIQQSKTQQVASNGNKNQPNHGDVSGKQNRRVQLNGRVLTDAEIAILDQYEAKAMKGYLAKGYDNARAKKAAASDTLLAANDLLNKAKTQTKKG